MWVYYMKCLVPSLLLLTLSGCINADLRALRHAPPSQDAYLKSLADYYLKFAESEARAYDWKDTAYFTDKGLKTVYGQKLEPDLPSVRGIAAGDQDAVLQARKSLMDVFTEKNQKEKPQALAKAVFHYDCWLEQLEEGWQKEDIAACKRGFDAAISEITGKAFAVPLPVVVPVVPSDVVPEVKKVSEVVPVFKKKMLEVPVALVQKVDVQLAVKPVVQVGASYPKQNKKVAKKEEKAIEKQVKKLVASDNASKNKIVVAKKTKEAQRNDVIERAPIVSSGRAVLFFKSKQDELNKQSSETLEQIAKRLKDNGGYRITLHGYVSGQSGSNDNLKTSYKRAQEIKKALVAQGLSADNIHVFAFGDKQGKISKADAKSDKSQRVELLIE